MKIVTEVLKDVENEDYSKVKPLLHFLRSHGDIAEAIDEAYEKETGKKLTQANTK